MSSSSIPKRPPAHGRYETLRTLGQGGAGTVYLARDRDTGAVIAIKKLLRMDPKSVLRLKREFRALADLRHRNLVELYDLGADDDGWFLTMEYVDGVDLFSHLRGGGILDSVDRDHPTRELAAFKDLPTFELEPVLSAFEQLACGMRALHQAGMLHRDLKPSNVLVANGRVVVLDFGLVREVDAQDALLSQDGVVAGTPAYMSPEQAGGQTLSAATDWYAFGVMLYQVLTGELPIDGRTPMDLIVRKLRNEPQRIERAVPWLPRELVDLCNGLLSREASERPTGEDVLRVLGQLSGQPAKDQLPTTLGLTTQTGHTTGHSLNPPRLVGRAGELAQLRAALKEARSSGAVVAHVRGASGAGKSALVEQFIASIEPAESGLAAAGEPLVLESRCNEREAMPFKALDGIVDGLVRHLLQLTDFEVGHLLPLDVADLAQLFPVMQRVPGVRRLLESTQTRGDALQTRIRGEVAFRELFARLARRRALVVWIDDLQWGDLDSANILKAWQEQLASSPLLLVFSYRSDEVTTSPCLRELLEPPPRAGARAVERIIELAALQREDLRELCTRKLGSIARAHPALIERIAGESHGNPFLVSQLAALALARIAQGDTDFGALSIEQMIEQTEQLIAPEATWVLRVLAIAGRPISPKLALRAAAVTEDGRTLIHALRSLRLIRVRDTGSSKLLEMYHDRVREAVVVSLEEAVRERIHADLFAAVEPTFSHDPDWLFSLTLGARQPAAALRYGLAAVDRAERALAFERAAELLERCIELSDPASPEFVRLQRRLAECLARAGYGARAADVYLQTAKRVDSSTALVCMRLAASHLLRSGDFARGERIVREVLAARGIGVPATDAGVLAALAWDRAALALRGLDFTPAESPLDPEELATIELFGTLAIEYQAYDPLRAALFQTRALRAALAGREPYSIARVLCATAVVTCVNGSARAARETDALLERAEAIARELNIESLRADVLASRSVTAYMLARTNEIIEPSYEAERIYRADPGNEASGDYFHRFVVIAVRIGALMTHGDYERAMIDLTRTREEARATNNRNAILQLSLVETLADGLHDDYASSKARLIEERTLLPERTFGPLHTLHMIALFRTACGLHDYTWAHAWLEADWKRWKRSLVRMSAHMSLLALGARLRYLVNRHVIERRNEDLEQVVRADVHAARKLPFEEGRIGLVARTRARLDFLAGRRESAIENMQHVVRLFESVGARGEVARERYALAFMLGGTTGSIMAAECERELRELGVTNPLGEVWASYPELRDAAFGG